MPKGHPGSCPFGLATVRPTDKREYMRIWRALNTERVTAARLRHRPKENARRRDLAMILRAQVHHFYGNRCARCGFSDGRALQVDHVHADGKTHRMEVGTSANYYKSILENPARYQLLCANCNWIKAFEEDKPCHRTAQ